jgi:large-conductance mechanosensitive channel
MGYVKEKFEKKEEEVKVEEPAKPTIEELLTEIRDTLKEEK